MANEHNLIPCNKRTPRELSEMGKKGAIASNKVQAEKKAKLKTMQEIFEVILLKKPSEETINKIKEQFPELNENDINTFFVLNNNFLNKFSKDLSNDKINITEYIKVLEFVRDNIGQKPIERLELSTLNIVVNSNEE